MLYLLINELINELYTRRVEAFTEQKNSTTDYKHLWKIWVRSAFSDDVELKQETRRFFRNRKIRR